MAVMSEEFLVDAALKVINLGVHGGELDHTDPMNQVLVAGAHIVLAARDANLSPEDVFRIIRENAKPEEPLDY